MDRFKTWALRFGLAGALAGALVSRDACLGGSHPPPPQPNTSQSSDPVPPAATTAPPAAPPAATPAPAQTFASPP